MTKVGVRMSIMTCVVSNMNIVTTAKCWNIAYPHIDRLGTTLHHTFERRQSFFVFKRVNESLVGLTISFIRIIIYRSRQREKIAILSYKCFYLAYLFYKSWQHTAAVEGNHLMTYLLQIFCHEVIETKKKGKRKILICISHEKLHLFLPQ